MAPYNNCNGPFLRMAMCIACNAHVYQWSGDHTSVACGAYSPATKDCPLVALALLRLISCFLCLFAAGDGAWRLLTQLLVLLLVLLLLRLLRLA